VTTAAEPVRAQRVIAGLSIFVVLAVGLVLFALPRRIAPPVAGPGVLATVNACLNGGATLALLSGFVFIRRGDVERHRASMLTAFGLSSVFLLTYLAHHATVGSVPYQGQGAARLLYFAILIPHVVLAAGVVPLALLTLRRGLVRDVARHRAIARVTLPIWLYVSVSGVLLYFMLYF
jgi:putative membrane protein